MLRQIARIPPCNANPCCCSRPTNWPGWPRSFRRCCTTAGAVSIGTELPQYTGAERVIVPRAYPRMTGYESVGTVIERVARGSPGNTVRIAGVV